MMIFDTDPTPASYNDYGEPKKKKSGGIIILIIGILIIAILLVTNPSEEKHMRYLVEAGIGSSGSDIGGDLGREFGGEIGEQIGSILGELLDSALSGVGAAITEYHNYLLFSTTSLNDRTITFGILGMVFGP